ncbi:MAG TPA: hypothetical protein V6D05_00095 [Stenomitos sp.]
MQSLVTLLVAGIALFALGCLVFGLLMVGALWATRKIVAVIAHFASRADRQARSCYNEPLKTL